MTQIHVPFEIPEVLDFKLRAVRRRLRLREATRGLFITIGALLIIMMLAMLIDELTMPIETRWRTILTLTSLSLTGVIFVFAFIRPVLRPRRLSSVAGQVEKNIPELEERWSTITELAESRDPPSFRGSTALINHVATEAVGLGWRVESRGIVSYRRAAHWACVCLACLAVLSITYLIAPEPTGVLFQRFWSPRGSITQTHITSSTGSLAVPFGEQLVVEAHISGRLRDHAELKVRDEAGAEQRFELIPSITGKDTFRHRLPSIKHSFAYCWQSGDSRSQWFTVIADHRPNIAQSRLKITPPAYTQLAEQELSPLPKQARFVRGTQVEVALLPSKQLAHLTLTLGKGLTETPRVDADGWYRYRTTLLENLVLSPRLQDIHGLTNLAPPTCRIIVYEDQPPKVEVISPEDEMIVRPDDTVKIEFKASDDFGIAEAELLVTLQEGGKEIRKAFPIPLENTKETKKLHQTATLDLKSLNLKEGAELTYAVQVRDSRAAAAMDRPSPRSSQSFASQPALANANTQPSSKQAETMPADSLADQTESSNSMLPSEADEACKPGEGMAQSKKSQNKNDKQDESGSKPPINDMTSRLLDLEGSCSNKQRLLVKEWSGSFEGQARKKLQIALTGFLTRLGEALRHAEESVVPLVSNARAETQWNEHHTSHAAHATQNLATAGQVVQELKEKSANSPYAYVGLQLVDIDVAHITPARRNLAEGVRLQTDAAARLPELEQSAYHIVRAREVLAALQAKFEAEKKAEQHADRVKELAKMHQLFLEDMAIMLKVCEPALNSREGKWKTVPDDVAAEILVKIKDRFEGKKRLLEALAKLLAEDPDLLRRFMANSRKSAHTLRDQLTILSRQQGVLRTLWDEWCAADPVKRKELVNQHRTTLIAEQGELVTHAGQFHDNVVTWIPRGLDAKQGPLLKCIELSRDLATFARQTQPADANDSIQPLLQWSDWNVQRLTSIQDAIDQAAELDKGNEKLQAFVTRRTAESGTLIARQTDWAQKLKAVTDGEYERVVHVDQKHLIATTEAFRVKMKGLAPRFGECFTTEIGKKTDELADVMERDINTHQVAACLALRKGEWVTSQQMEANAVAGFIKAEKLFDEILTAVEKSIAEQPTQPPTTAPAPPPIEEHLANLLKCLDQEGDACEKLGAVVHTNIMVQGDWMSPEEGEGSGTGQGTGSGQGTGEATPSDANQPAQTEATKSQKEKLPPQLQAALAELRSRQAEAEEAFAGADGPNDGRSTKTDNQGKPAEGSGRGEDAPKKNVTASRSRDERDWNVFVAKLEDELKQSHANVPPEQYRRPIADYFRSISEAVARASSSQPAGER